MEGPYYDTPDYANVCDKYGNPKTIKYEEYQKEREEKEDAESDRT